MLDAQVDGRSLRVEVQEQQDGRYRVSLDGRALLVDAQAAGRGFVSLLIDGQSHAAGLERRGDGYLVVIGQDSFTVELSEAVAGTSAAPREKSGPARLKAPMPGKIVRVLARPGDALEAGQGLVVMEAMKMENELKSPRAGKLSELKVNEGQTVESGQLIAVVE